MKKTLIVTLLILSSMFSLANARFFIGIDGGYSMDRVDVEIEEEVRFMPITIAPEVKTANAYKGNGYVFNLNLGTQHYFNQSESIGFRWLLNLGYGKTDLVYQEDKRVHFPSNIIEATLGADILLDIIKFGNQNSLGIFGGIEGGVFSTFSDKFYDEFRILETGTLDIAPRIGLSLFLAQHHRIEFIAKIPIYDILSSSYGNVTRFYKPTQFMLGYKFVF